MIIKNIRGEVLYRSKANTIKETLEEAVRNKVSLYNAQLNGVAIVGACLDGAILKKALFQQSFLYKTSFYKAHLNRANFFLADLSGASFKDASLSGAQFQNAYLIGANINAKTPPLGDHRYISEILWRSARTESQRDFAARVRVETYGCWEHFYLLAKEKKVLTWAKRTLSKWAIYREQIQFMEGKLKR